MQIENEARGPEWMPGYWINRASRLIMKTLDARLRPLGFALSYLPVLRALSDGKDHSQSELAEIAGVEQPSMAETLVRMERDGVIKREPHPSDKRASVVSVTSSARTRFKKVRLVLVDAEKAAMTGFSNEERLQFRELLRRFVNNLEQRRTK